MWNECTKCKKWQFFAQIHGPIEVARVWDSRLQAKWKRVEVRGGARQEGKKGSSKRGVDANSDLFSEFTAGSVVWARMSGMFLFPLCNNQPYELFSFSNA